MLRNYLVVALRSFQKHPFYALMNVVGLAVGLAACILIILYIEDEVSFDRMHEASDRIYRVVEARTAPDHSVQHYVYTTGALGPELERSVPEVSESVRAVSAWAVGRRVVQRDDVRFYVGDHLFTEPEYFEIFDFPFVAGSRAGALDAPFEVVLTEESVQTYFGADDPVGQTLAVEGMGDYTVAGVVRLPENTHVDYSMFFSLTSFSVWEGFWADVNDWSSSGTITYLVLAPGADVGAVETKIRNLVQERADADVYDSRTQNLQALGDIHLGSAHIDFDENHTPGRLIYLYLFGAVAVFVVLIAAMNYMNMATARSMRRAREIGMRKVVGAGRGQLAGQFLAESILTAVLALLVGAGIVRLALPTFNRIADKAITLDLSAHVPVLLGIVGLTLLVGIIAGAYPAFYLSRFRPSAVLRGMSGVAPGGSPIRKGLVVAQFAMSIALITATMVVGNQLEYVQTKQLGFEEDQLLIIDINGGSVRSQFDAVMDEFAQIPGVRSVAVSNNVPGDWKYIPQTDVALYGQDEVTSTHFLGIDEAFLATYEMKLLEGRTFDGDFGTDSTSVLLNETAARILNARIGDRIRLPEDEFVATVIGIVEDFHFKSLHEPIGPLLLGYRANPIDYIDYFTVRIDGPNVPRTIQKLRDVGERFDPDHPFEYNFLDARLADFYTREQRVRQIFGAAAALAVFIACLGLFGLASYSAEQRTKEIGIRKTLGASASSIIALMTTDFAKLVGIAFLVAAPISYLAMRWWLQDFAYRTSIGISTLLLAGGTALLLAILSVTYQSLRAAVSDPVESLRYE